MEMPNDPISAIFWAIGELVKYMVEQIRVFITKLLKALHVKEGTKPKAGMESTLQRRPEDAVDRPIISRDWVFREWMVDRTNRYGPPRKPLIAIRSREV